MINQSKGYCVTYYYTGIYFVVNNEKSLVALKLWKMCLENEILQGDFDVTAKKNEKNWIDFKTIKSDEKK